MIDLTITAPSLARLRARWAESPTIIREELEAGTRTATDAVRDAVRERTPVRTGALRSSIVSRFEGVGSADFRGTVSVIGPGKPYAGFVEAGTRAHVIEPRFKEALRFTMGGRVIFARRVRHPGTPAFHMFADGWRAAEPRVRRIYAARLGNVTRRLRSNG